MKLLRPILVILALIVFPLSGMAKDEVVFSWAFFLKDDSGQVRSLEFDYEEMVEVGDLLRIFLESEQKTYLYLYLHDSRDDLYMVYPPGVNFYKDTPPVGHSYHIPSTRDWFIMDRSEGVERFYLLAAHKRLGELEDLTGSFLAERTDSAKQSALLAKLELLIEENSNTAKVDILRTPMLRGKRSGDLGSVSGSKVNRVWASGDYGMVLDLVSR